MIEINSIIGGSFVLAINFIEFNNLNFGYQFTIFSLNFMYISFILNLQGELAQLVRALR
jgi:hypothetical protein